MKMVWKDGYGRLVVYNVERNELCLCGSKMKFKHCCIDKVDPPVLLCRGKRGKKQVKDVHV